MLSPCDKICRFKAPWEMTMRLLCLMLLLVATLQGCGYKGPLYLPQKADNPQQDKK
jgi:predicted small lipoprotein YifL